MYRLRSTLLSCHLFLLHYNMLSLDGLSSATTAFYEDSWYHRYKIKSTHFCDDRGQNLLKQELYIKLTCIAHLFTITVFLMVMSVFFIFCDQNAEFDVSQSLILSELGMYIAELTSTVAMHVFSCSDIIHLQ